MTIEKGSDWGEIVAARRDGVHPIGDLSRDLGVGDVSRHGGPWRRLPLDVIEVEVLLADGSRTFLNTTAWFRCGRKLIGALLIVSSTSFVAGRRLFARAHPNDGRLDWLRISPDMPIRQRLTFWRRTRTETHLPHPSVLTGAGGHFEMSFGRPTVLTTAEGRRLKSVVRIEAQLVPDAAATHIPAL